MARVWKYRLSGSSISWGWGGAGWSLGDMGLLRRVPGWGGEVGGGFRQGCEVLRRFARVYSRVDGQVGVLRSGFALGVVSRLGLFGALD